MSTSTSGPTRVQFNTGRPYASEGQRIVVQVRDGQVLFHDTTRLIGGRILAPFEGSADELQSFVMRHYDDMNYESEREAFALRWQDETLPRASIAVQPGDVIEVRGHGRCIVLEEYGGGELALRRISDQWLVNLQSDRRDDMIEAVYKGQTVQVHPTEPGIFQYVIDLDERGEFRADVRDAQGRTVFEIEGFDIFEDGFMADKEDLGGLREYLVSLSVLREEDMLTMDDVAPVAEEMSP